MVYFISYGNEKYKNSKIRIETEAKKMGFDSVKIYSPSDISQDFIQKTTPYINMERGGGYWLWKSFFFKENFHKMNNDDILVYADAGCHINIYGKKRLLEYYEMVKNSNTGILSFELTGFLEEWYTNEKIFEYFNIESDSKIRKESIISATIIIMRKCENTIKLIDEFYKIATEHPDLFSDEHNCYKQSLVFKDNRHDQSIFSILRKLTGTVLIPDETYANNWNDLIHIPILATRIRE